MTDLEANPMEHSRTSPWHWLVRAMMVLSLISITGCGGCRDKDPNDPEQQDPKEKKLLKEDFDSLIPMAMPSIMNDPERVKRRNSRLNDDPIRKEIAEMLDKSRRRHRVKVGHWHDLRFQAIANNFDFQGELDASATRNGVPINVEGTKFLPVFNRPVALSKGEWKTFETSVFLPQRPEVFPTQAIECEIHRGRSGLASLLNTNLPGTLRPHQHHLVLLSTNPDRFSFLDLAPTIRLPTNSTVLGERNAETYVVIPSNPGVPLPLPRNALAWTTIAYVIWDDLDPDQLGLDQQQALIDWLHFGGQLILSGPDCLERMESSFLGPYLPAQAEAAANLVESDLAELNSNWSLPEKNAQGKTRDLLVSEKLPLLGISFLPHENATYLAGSGELVIERQLGRGRIVASAFPLAAAPVRSWRSFDSFLNNVLLRRPSRKFVKAGLDSFYEAPDFVWQNDQADRTDPMLHTTLRFLSRDLGNSSTRGTSPDALAVANPDADSVFDDSQMPRQPRIDHQRNLDQHWYYGGYEADSATGMSAWEDFDGVARAARETLLDAAGIAPPSSTLVLKMLCAYLVVLVPLNWLIFRSIGKVEYAWIAAPLISVVGAVIVIRMASLDIGFTRSNTQVGLLEIQPGHDRGHLTEYAALYTSLSTEYRVEMDDNAAQVLPFPPSLDVGRPADSDLSELHFSRSNRGRLDGLQIESSTTDLLHMEQLVSLGGTVRLDAVDGNQLTVSNRTQLDFGQAFVIGSRQENGQLVRVAAWVESIAAGETKTVTLEPVEDLPGIYESVAVFGNSERRANQLWQAAFADSVMVPFEQLQEIDEVNAQWEAYRTLVAQRYPGSLDQMARVDFVDIFQELNPTPGVTLGRLVDQVITSLKPFDGGYRLYASTPEKVGGNRILPEATQTDRQTLIVAHLTPPPLPLARPDANSIDDLKITSDLDYEQEMNLFDPNEDAVDQQP